MILEERENEQAEEQEHRQWLDRSPSTTLALCTCGARELFFTPAGAWGWAVEHAGACHGDNERARNSRTKWLKRDEVRHAS